MALYTILFILPGFSMSFAYGFFVPQRDKAYQPVFLRFLFFSCINFSIWWPLLYGLIQDKYWNSHPFQWSLIIILLLILSPFIVGMLVGVLVQKEVLRTLLHRIKMHTLHPVPTAWDYIMSNPAWVIVTIKDGTIIHGKYLGKSLASSVPNEKDLFIEELYTVKEGEWVAAPNSTGIWVPGDQILYIEFYEYKI